MTEPVYFVYLRQNGQRIPQKWFGDQTKGTGQFQRGEVGTGDLAHFQLLTGEEIQWSIDQLLEKYPYQETSNANVVRTTRTVPRT